MIYHLLHNERDQPLENDIGKKNSERNFLFEFHSNVIKIYFPYLGWLLIYGGNM